MSAYEPKHHSVQQLFDLMYQVLGRCVIYQSSLGGILSVKLMSWPMGVDARVSRAELLWVTERFSHWRKDTQLSEYKLESVLNRILILAFKFDFLIGGKIHRFQSLFWNIILLLAFKLDCNPLSNSASPSVLFQHTLYSRQNI